MANPIAADDDYLAFTLHYRLVPKSARTIIHTGFWGCGAFGGNRTLMTILQSLAADLAGVEVVFWAFDESGVRVGISARETCDAFRKATTSAARLLDQLTQQKYEWEVSDGN